MAPKWLPKGSKWPPKEAQSGPKWSPKGIRNFLTIVKKFWEAKGFQKGGFGEAKGSKKASQNIYIHLPEMRPFGGSLQLEIYSEERTNCRESTPPSQSQSQKPPTRAPQDQRGPCRGLGQLVDRLHHQTELDLTRILRTILVVETTTQFA